MGEPEDDTVIAPPRRARPGTDDVLTGDTIILGRAEVPRTDAGPPRPAASAALPRPTVDPVPARARVRVNGARPFELTAPVVVGRRPAPPRVPGRETPLLVAVPSPTQEVSGSHLEIRQQGTTVVITDLRSTNGSVVTAPGRAALTLRQGDSIVVVPGTVIDLGDGNSLDILPAARLQPAQHHGKA